MAETETNSLTINKGSLYPFIYQPRTGVAYKDAVSKLEGAILAMRVNNAEPGYYYRLRYVNFKPSDAASTSTNNGWVISKIKKEDYEAGVSPDIDLTLAASTKHRLIPDGGVQRFTITSTRNGDASIDFVIDPTGVPEVTYINSGTTGAGYQHIIDPLLYHYSVGQSTGGDEGPKDALTINKNSLYPFIYTPRGEVNYDTNKQIPTELESAILSIRVNNAQPGYYYYLRYFYHNPDADETGTNNGWTFTKVKISDYEAGIPDAQIDVTRAFECHKKLDMTKNVERFTLVAGNGDNTSFDVVIDPSIMPKVAKAYVASDITPNYQHIIDPMFYDYDPLGDESAISKVGVISNQVRKAEMNPIRPTLTCTAYGLLPIDVFGQPRFDNMLLYQDIDSQTVPASITKLMTALVAIESGMPVDSVITIQESDLTVGSGYNLQVGDEITLEGALYNLMTVSSNTSATAIARAVGEYIGGGYDGFIQEMNRKAAEFGMSNTNFTNPSGVVGEQHYASVKALMLLGWRSSLDPVLSNIWSVKTSTLVVSGPNAREIELNSISTDMSHNPWFIGSKTGSITGWGYNILAHVNLKNGFKGIAVCIRSNSSEDRVNDLEAMVNYVRENYSFPAPAKIIAKA